MQQDAPEVTQSFGEDLPANISALVVCTVVALFANAAGVGGGSVFVAAFTALMSWSLPTSVALSQATIATSAGAGALACLLQSHPEALTEPLVSYELGLVLLPGMVAGITVGVLLNAVSPPWLTAAVLTVLLLYIANKSISKARNMLHKEAEERQRGAEDPHTQDSATEPLLDKQQPGWQEYLRKRAGFGLMLLFSAVLCGTETQKRENQRCNARFAIVTGSQAVLCLLTMAAAGYWLQHQDSTSSDDDAEDGGASKAQPAVSIPRLGAYSLVGGIVAGALGIGGGFVIGPMCVCMALTIPLTGICLLRSSKR